ncbi:hypothetical protein QAD02_000588 [Eretmocerus hayati]|uniref:Uncharacterized protein n=1 Tax=Eretmocerus hayati TaxID=131215 RepID=A0ACC2NE36_9HYME|nr:hypothetical protein QAD02_000588 [Eretmocerus hayati]
MHFGTIIFTAEFLFVTLASNLETAYEWRHVDYLWPSSKQRQEAIRSGNYEIGSPVITDVDVSEDKRVFVSLTGSQVPARLAVVTNHVGPSGPLLQPYPSWNWTDRNDCNSIITPSRIEIDNCNRLWIIDSAQTGMKKKHCEPKLLGFDLGTDKLITKVEIPQDVAININTNRSLFTNIRVETHGESCEMTTVILAKDDKGLPYVSGIKVIPQKVFGEEQVWLITNRVLLHNAHTNRNAKEINFRILRSPVKKLITKTKCEMPFETRYELGTMPGHLK